MTKVFLFAAVLLTVLPVEALVSILNGQLESGGQSGQFATSQPSTTAPTTGVICEEEMTATFCNVVTGPNSGGYGSNGAGSSAGSGSGVGSGPGGGASAGSIMSIPPCGSEPPPNELCD